MMDRRAVTEEQKAEILNRLLTAWLAFPEQRLGQLIENYYGRVSPLDVSRPPDLYHIEDYDLVENIERGITQCRCDHGLTFDAEAAGGLDEYAVRKRWPRLFGACPKGCGYSGIAYASTAHYIAGDW